MTPNHPPQLTGDHELGIFADYAEDAYRAAPGVCQSDLKEMLISPAHFISKLCGPKEESTDAQIIGTLTHRAILEDRHEYVIQPDDVDRRSKDGKAWFVKQTLPVIKREIVNDLAGMARSVNTHPDASAILSAKGHNEVACWARCPDTGLLLRGRADRVTTDDAGYTTIVDIKTVQRGCAGEEAFPNEIKKWNYHVQAKFYLDLFGASFFIFIAVEKEPPYAVDCHNVSPATLAIGLNKYKRALARVKECMDSGQWPAYPPGIKTIDLPAWVMRKELA